LLLFCLYLVLSVTFS